MKHVLLLVILYMAVCGVLEGTIINTNITSSTTWTLAGSPYIISANITIYGASSPILTIEPGVQVRFDAGYSLGIGHTSSGTNFGGIVVNGTAESPVIFTANSESPVPGYWATICSNNYALPDSVVFNHAIFEYGGSGNGLFDVIKGNPQFNHCTFRYSASSGLYHTSTTTSATIQNCSFENNGDYPLVWSPAYVSQIGDGNTYLNNQPNRILLKSITLTEGCTWTDKGIPFEPISNVIVQNQSDPLRIEAGVSVFFRVGKALLVGSNSSPSITGSLQASGATFTAVDSDAGWNGIAFQSYTQASSLSNCIISEVSAGANSAVYLHCNIFTEINGCTITQNDTYGINLGNGASCSIANTTISNNANAVNISIGDVFRLRSGNSYLNNTTNSIYCRGGGITVPTTWTKQSVPLLISSNSYFYGSGYPEMIIPYGTVIEFAQGVNFAIGSTTSPTLTGTLHATGVTFRGEEANAGYWTGLIFNIYGGSSVLSACIIKDAGFNSAAAIGCNCTNGTITGCTIYNCAGDGIYMNPNCLVSLSGNVIFSCGAYPLSIGANSLRILGANNYFTGNSIDRIEVRAETITTSGTWRNAGVPYLLTGTINIYGDSLPHLALQPGVIIMMPDAMVINIGSSSSPTLRGSLAADGVTFTRSSEDAIPQGLVFQPYLVSESCVLSDCIFEYLQQSSQNSAVYVTGSSPSFQSCTFRNNPGGGIVASNTARPVINNCSFLNNGSYPVKTNAPAFDVVSGVGNYFSGNNPDRILISGGTITINSVWDNPSVPVEVTGDISIYAASTPILQIN